MTAANAGLAIEAGATGVAVSSAILDAPDIESETRKIIEFVKRARVSKLESETE